MTTITKEVPWGLSEQIFGITLGNDDVLVAHFMVPADAVTTSRNGSISCIPIIQGSAGTLQGVLSERPGDFSGYVSPNSIGPAPGAILVVGVDVRWTCRLEAGRDYYFNVRNYSPAPTQAPSQVLIEFHSPKVPKAMRRDGSPKKHS